MTRGKQQTRSNLYTSLLLASRSGRYRIKAKNVSIYMNSIFALFWNGDVEKASCGTLSCSKSFQIIWLVPQSVSSFKLVLENCKDRGV